MKSMYILLLVILEVLLLSGCAEVTCNVPYIKMGTSCCLDENNNSICDDDETQTNTPSGETKTIPAVEKIKEPEKIIQETMPIVKPKTNFIFQVINAEKKGNIIESIKFAITNNKDEVIKSLTCYYSLYNGKGNFRVKNPILVVSNSTISNLGIFYTGATKQLTTSPYKDMYDSGPYKIIFECENEFSSFNLTFNPTCSDDVQNQGEIGIDCGGPCDNCIYKVKETINVDNVEFTVVSIQTENVVGSDEYSFTQKRAKGVYYIVYLIIKNVDKQTRNIYPRDFVVVDANGNVYDDDKDAEFYYDEYGAGVSFEYKEDLSPTIETRGHLIYDLPRSVTNPRLGVYSYSDGDIKYITLK